MAFTWKGLVIVSRDASDRVDISSSDHLFYLGPMTVLLDRWFDRWAYGRREFYAFAKFDGIALVLLYHATAQDWRRAQEQVASMPTLRSRPMRVIRDYACQRDTAVLVGDIYVHPSDPRSDEEILVQAHTDHPQEVPCSTPSS